MANEANKLSWLEVDASSLPKPLKASYGELKSAQSLAKEKKQAFEAAMISEAAERGHITADQTLMFSYRFGKLSMAIGEKKQETAPKASKNAFRF
jgi:predicted transcriptional regulator